MVSEPQVVGRYAIYDKIASGGMASVHFGRLIGAIGFTRTVAIKRLHPHLLEDPAFVKTMVDEARLSSRIHHPNVVSTLDVVATESELLIVMEYVRGDSVARLARNAPSGTNATPLPMASAIAAGALQGLHAAHEATSDLGTPLEIVHRDVSPQNILVGVDGTPRIIDFGVAKAAVRLQTTSDGVVKGKLGYMAPEQLRGEAVTRRADIYAMGVVLWQMLTGRKLFQGEDQATLIGQILANAKVPPSRYVPGLPEGLDALVMKALGTDPAARFATAKDMAEALVAIVPPPLPTEVGAWVQDVAKEALARRAAVLAEIESTSARAVASEDGGTQVSSVSQATPPGTEGSRTARTRGVALVTIAVAAVIAGAAMLVHRTAPRAAVESVEPTASSLVGAGEPPVAASVSAASSAPEPASADVPAASSPPPVAAPATSASTSPPRWVRPSARGRPPSLAPARNCNPNFYYDAAGQKIFKPECFTR